MIHRETLDDARTAGVAPWDQLVEELSDFHVAVFQDRYPVTAGHLLFVPNYNTNAVIINCMESAMLYGRRMVEQGYCEGFNIGINVGPAAGQTVMYPHVHLIPRRSGDCADPIGGVRGVIPGQANYKADGYQLPADDQDIN
jgi:diadenosine tetraphosphate (Ap4A) HIT family hydrolase